MNGWVSVQLHTGHNVSYRRSVSNGNLIVQKSHCLLLSHQSLEDPKSDIFPANAVTQNRLLSRALANGCNTLTCTIGQRARSNDDESTWWLRFHQTCFHPTLVVVDICQEPSIQWGQQETVIARTIVANAISGDAHEQGQSRCLRLCHGRQDTVYGISADVWIRHGQRPDQGELRCRYST